MMKPPADWTVEEWHVHTMKMAAMLDGMTVNEVHKILDVLKNIAHLSTVFRMDTPEFQRMVQQVVFGELGD